MNKSKSRCRMHENIKGFSLLELMIVMTILVIILGVLSGIIGSVQASYARQRPRIEATNNANAAMDIMTRLIRMAGNNISGNGSGIYPGSKSADDLYHTIRIKADWHPADGTVSTTAGSLEDVSFQTTSNGIFQIKEGSGGAWVDNLESIGSLIFTYYDGNNNVVSTPTDNDSSVALVKIDLQTTGASPITFTSKVHVRKN